MSGAYASSRVDAVHGKLLWFATRCVLAATSQSIGVQDLEANECMEAAVLLEGLPDHESFALWSRPVTARLLVQMLAVAVRQAEDNRVASIALTCSLLRSFSQSVRHTYASSHHGKTHAETLRSRNPVSEQLRIAALALLRCGTLSCLSRVLAQRIHSSCVSAADTRSDVDAGVSTSITSSGNTPTFPNAHTNTLVLDAIRLVYSLGSLTQIDPPDVVGQALLDALRSSSLLEHISRLAFHAMLLPHVAALCDSALALHPLQDVAGRLQILGFLFRPRAAWVALRARQLPGPQFHYLMTAAAVEVMADLDGGPRYGLPPTAVTRSLETINKPKYYCGKVLQNWALMLMPDCDLPWRQGYLSPRAVYELCLRAARVCAAAVRSLDGGAWPGGNGGGGQAAGVGGDSSGCPAGDGGSSGSSASAGHAAAHGVLRERRVAPTTGAREVYSTAGMAAVAAAHCALRVVSKGRRAGRQAAAHAAAAAARETTQAGAAAAAAAAAPLDWEVAEHEGGKGTTEERLEGRERVPAPPEWWRAAVAALGSAVVPADAEYVAGDDDDDNCRTDAGLRSLLSCALFDGSLVSPLPASLPPDPPTDVAAAMAYGFVPCLERSLRDAFRGASSSADFNLYLCARWKQRGWLAAYTDPRVTAALVMTTLKVSLKLESPGRRPPLLRLTAILIGNGLAWASERQVLLAMAAARGCAATSSAAAASAAATSDSRGSGAEACAHTDERSHRLLLMLSFMLDRGLTLVCTSLANDLSEHLKLPLAARAERLKSDMEFAADVLIVLDCLLAMLDAGGGGHAPTPRLAAADDWRGLLVESGAAAMLCVITYTASLTPVPAGFAELMQRVLRGMLRHCTEGMRTALGQMGGVFLERVFGPAGCMADPELLQALRAVRDGGQGPTGPAARDPTQTAVVLPPLSEVRSVLRTCANRWCTNLAGPSEADLVPQPGGGAGGRSNAGRASRSSGRPEDEAPRCCSLVCREEIKRARRAAARARA